MMVGNCAGCQTLVGYVFAAQYRVNGEGADSDVVLCKVCWDRGVRMWIDDAGSHEVGVDCPSGFREAMLYYDEGGYVTGRDASQFTYPDFDQPAASKDTSS